MKIIILISMFLLIFTFGCNDNKNAQPDSSNESIDSTNSETIQPLETYRLLCFVNDFNSNQYSRAIIPVLDTLQLNYFGRFTIEIIDIDSNPEFIDSFNIKFAPHIVIINSNDSIVFSRTGHDPYVKLIKALKKKNLID